jgi:hypothetical protein
MANLQLPKDLFANILLCINPYYLSRSCCQYLSRTENVGLHTFLAITTFVPACMTLLTVPPFPAPSSFSTTKSSLLRSSLNSRPISRVSVLLLSVFPSAPGICESPSEGFDDFAGGALSASPFTFFRFKVLALNGSDIVVVEMQIPSRLLGPQNSEALLQNSEQISEAVQVRAIKRGYGGLVPAATGGVVQE